jgi:hypothetical protein
MDLFASLTSHQSGDATAKGLRFTRSSQRPQCAIEASLASRGLAAKGSRIDHTNALRIIAPGFRPCPFIRCSIWAGLAPALWQHQIRDRFPSPRLELVRLAKSLSRLICLNRRNIHLLFKQQWGTRRNVISARMSGARSVWRRGCTLGSARLSRHILVPPRTGIRRR